MILSGPLGGENLPTFLQIRVVCYLGVTFTPSELATTGTVSSTTGRRCRSLKRGLNAEARPPLLQWRCSRSAVTAGVQKYEAIFPNPKMDRLAWIVTRHQIVPLLLAYRFSTP